jgi:5-methylcytosine-specific restriction endonuclease McrA
MDSSDQLQVGFKPRSWLDIPSRREILWNKASRKCHWCGNPTLLNPLRADGSRDPHAWNKATIDHVIPRYKHGTDDDSNLVSACNLCNNRRSHEDTCGLPEGSLLGQYNPGAGKKVKNSRKPDFYRHIALTGDEKKAIRAGKLPTSVKHNTEDVLREQRDQALLRIGTLEKELRQYKATVEAQEMKLNAQGIWRIIRTRIVNFLVSK